MRRRQVLAALGTSIVPLAGCISGSSSGETSDSTPSSSMTETPKSEFPALSVSSEYEQPPDAKMAVERVRQFTTDKPAKIKISYTNTAESERKVPFQASPPFSEYVSTKEGSPRLVIIPDDHSHISPGKVIQNHTRTESPTENQTDSHQLIPKTPIDGCWKVPTAFAVYGMAHPKTLSPGETISEDTPSSGIKRTRRAYLRESIGLNRTRTSMRGRHGGSRYKCTDRYQNTCWKVIS